MFLRYAFSTQPYATEGNITIDRLCNGMTIKNAGNSVCIFNNDPLQPGESKAIGGNYGEILQVRMSLRFEPIASPPPGYVQNDSAFVTQKYYLPNQGIEVKSAF